MATFTKNLNLEKPAANDFYDIEVQNSNMEKIDEAISNSMPKSGGEFSKSVYFANSQGVHFKTANGNQFRIVADSNKGFIQVLNSEGSYVADILAFDLATGGIISSQLMPKSGGTFTGNVAANSTNRGSYCLRNIAIYPKDNLTNAVLTNSLFFQRK